jgi:hypothetical protein
VPPPTNQTAAAGVRTFAMTPRRAPFAGLIVGLAIGAWAPPGEIAGLSQVSATLSNGDFWRLTQDLSEPDGSFSSDNLVSDELLYRDVVPTIADEGRRHGVFLGVGPEQNFTYIAALEPSIVFIIDIRRGNLQLQLMYKALFELSADRADFVSRLFTKPRPAGLSATSSARDIMTAYWTVRTDSESVYRANLAAIQRVLLENHRLPLAPQDLEGIEYVYSRFYWHGPAMTWATTSGRVLGLSGLPTFGDLMKQTDAKGRELSFLATEAAFAGVKGLQEKNLIVPVVGDFGGPKAIRAVGDYIRAQRATVSAFYVSEVEPLLVRKGQWSTFCSNVATSPVTGTSVLIRPPTVSLAGTGAILDKSPSPAPPILVPVAAVVKNCALPR